MPREQNLDVKRPRDGKSSTPYIDITTLALDLMKHGAEMYFGTMTGTGANLDSPTLPFDPACVIILNETDQSVHIATPGTGAGKCMSIKAAAAWVAAAGITLGTKKFTLGTNADLNAAADVLHFIAIGARDLGGSL